MACVGPVAACDLLATSHSIMAVPPQVGANVILHPLQHQPGLPQHGPPGECRPHHSLCVQGGLPAAAAYSHFDFKMVLN